MSILMIAFVSTVGLLRPETAAAAGPPSADAWSFSMSFGRGRLGVGVVSMTPQLRRFFGAPQDRGLLISRVEPQSVAEKAGLRVGDVVVAVDGQSVASAGDVFEALADRARGDAVDVVVIRKKKRLRKRAKLADDGPVPRLPNVSFEANRERRLERELEQTQKKLDAIERRLDMLGGQLEAKPKAKPKKKTKPRKPAKPGKPAKERPAKARS